MKITTSYAVEIKHASRIFDQTVQIYRDALSYLIQVMESQWPILEQMANSTQRFNWAEAFIHTTKNHVAGCDFDQRFPNMPSYFRRSVLQSALGDLSSYHSNYDKWVKSGRRGKAPKLAADRLSMPCFYRDNTYMETNNPCEISIKLFRHGNWVWVPFQLLPTDVRYIQRHCANKKKSAPTLERRHGKYFLRFAFTEDMKLYNTPIENQTVCAVDLGLNTDAVCSIMRADGTILARKFIDFPSDKGHLYHVLNRIKKAQRKHGSHNIGSFWRYARAINKELSVKIAAAIVDFAALYSCDTIVFEHLDFTRGKKIRGSKKQRIAIWRKNFIQEVATTKAHQNGMHISRICAWNTSRLAFDGSGKVVRDSDNHAWATFQNGKRYNCDLSASYNIGARYFIRELLKPLPVRVRSQVEAKVPGCERRTSCTYSTLLSLSETLTAMAS